MAMRPEPDKMHADLQKFFQQVKDHCICPDCSKEFEIRNDMLVCAGCGKQYAQSSKIVRLLPGSSAAHNTVQQLCCLYDRASEKYKGSPKSCGYATDASFMHRLNMLHRWIDPDSAKDLKVLDIGCGTGLMTRALVRHNDVWGVDISMGLLWTACKNGIKTVQGSAESLPFKDDLFDLVVCMGVLPYYTDPENIFFHLARVTKPGGTAVITSTTDSLLIKWVRNVKNMFWKKSQLKRLYTPADLKVYMTAQGLDVMDACLGYDAHIVSCASPRYPAKFRLLARVAAVYGSKPVRIRHKD
jgi:SAM-dependent methyltransferase